MSDGTVLLRVEGVLFDSDGVLVDSHAQVDVAWRALAAEFDLDFAVLATHLVGVPARSTLSRHLSGDPLERAIVRLEELEVETAATTAPVAGAIELLERLPLDRWAIVTSATRRLGVARWTGASLPPAAQSVTFDDVTHGKPHPEPFLAGARRLRCAGGALRGVRGLGVGWRRGRGSRRRGGGRRRSALALHAGGTGARPVAGVGGRGSRLPG